MVELFVLTVDQVDSTHLADAVPGATEGLAATFGDHLVLAPQRTAGDEFQTLVHDAGVALDVCLWLTRRGTWNVGVGVGAVHRPLPEDVRAASGAAFVAARRAVDAAKKSTTRCAVRVATNSAHGDDVGPLLDLLLALRARRTAEGWEVYDLLRQGTVTQRQVARQLSITEQAVSARIRSAEIRIEEAATAPIAHLLAAADRAPSADGRAV